MWGPGTRRTAAALVVGLGLAGCGSGGGTGGGVAWDDAPASLGVITPGVDVADEPAEVEAATFRTGEDGEGLVVSDLVRTDSAGFAEVRWVEGALARLDVDTVLEVTALDLETGQPAVSTRLEVGRVWNRLEAGVAEYEVTTDVGTAAVRGTGFLVACTAACIFGVAEGVLELETSLGVVAELRPGERLSVDEDGQPGNVEPFDTEDAWVQRNIGLDGDLGFPDVVGAFDPDGSGRSELARARMEGTYTFEFTVTESSDESNVGRSPDPFTYTFTPDCETGPCGGVWNYRSDDTTSFVWPGSGYAATYVRRPNSQGDSACPDGSPRFLEDLVVTFRPTSFEEVDGRLVVTAADAQLASRFVPIEASQLPSGCDPGTPTSFVLTGSGTRSG